MEINEKTGVELSIRINKIANSSLDAIELFKDTPIYNSLLKRRLIAKEFDCDFLNEDKFRLFQLIENEIKQFLLIY